MFECMYAHVLLKNMYSMGITTVKIISICIIILNYDATVCNSRKYEFNFFIRKQ